MTMPTTTITISKVINTDTLFEAVIGSDFYGCTDFIVPRSLTVNENKKTITCKYFDVDNLDSNGYYKQMRVVLTIASLVNAYSNLLANNQTHCGGHRLDVEDYDGCFGYFVLQQAIYGKINF
jgi:hypothetical protein